MSTYQHTTAAEADEAAGMKEEMVRMDIRMLQDWTRHYLNNPLVEESVDGGGDDRPETDGHSER
jgi:hypothetical protein